VKYYARRVVIRQGITLLSSAFAFPAVLHAAASAAESCLKPSSQALMQSLNYMTQSKDPSKPCMGCAFFTVNAAGGSCGTCMIANGPVDPTGHCDSWAAKG